MAPFGIEMERIVAGAPFAIFESTRLAIFVLNLSRRGSAVSRDLAISIFLPLSPACSHGDASHDARRRKTSEGKTRHDPRSRGIPITRPGAWQTVPWKTINTDKNNNGVCKPDGCYNPYGFIHQSFATVLIVGGVSSSSFCRRLTAQPWKIRKIPVSAGANARKWGEKREEGKSMEKRKRWVDRASRRVAIKNCRTFRRRVSTIVSRSFFHPFFLFLSSSFSSISVSAFASSG